MRCVITMTKENINYGTNNSNNKSSTAERKANTLCPWCKSSDAVIKEGENEAIRILNEKE